MHGNKDIVVGVVKGYHMAFLLNIVCRKHLEEWISRDIFLTFWKKTKLFLIHCLCYAKLIQYNIVYDQTPHDACLLHEKGKLDMQIQTPSKGCGQRINGIRKRQRRIKLQSNFYISIQYFKGWDFRYYLMTEDRNVIFPVLIQININHMKVNIEE